MERTGFIQALTDFLASPIGLLVLIACVLMSLAARTSNAWRWRLIALLIFASSLKKFQDLWVPESPPFAPFLETIIENGRSITILLIGLTFVLVFSSPLIRSRIVPPTLVFLLIAQAVLVLKTFAVGDFGFAAAMAFVTVSLAVIACVGLPSWMLRDTDLDEAIGAIAIAGALWLAATGIQAVLGPEAIFVKHGRLNGVSGNAQHAAALLGACAPAVLYMALMKRDWERIFWILVAVGLALSSYFTGSRTGMVMLVVGFVVVAWSAGLTRILGPVVGAGLALLASSAIFGLQVSDNEITERYTGFEDTRSDIWKIMFDQFLANPLFGVSDVDGGRLGFGESSWLAMAASAGLIGLIPLLLFGFGTLALIWRLLWLRNDNRSRAGVAAAGLASLLVGSIAEAYLLGSMSAPFLITCVYIALAARILAPLPLGRRLNTTAYLAGATTLR